jgi:hypothetical protein
MKRLFFAVVTITLALCASSATARTTYIPVPAKYRFTGVVGTLASPASHAIFVGDGISFFFSDKGLPPVKAYRVCLYRKGSSAAARCWRRTISRRNYDRDRFTTLSLPMGQAVAVQWVARWYAAGRLAATWRFIYLLEGE